MAKRRRASAPRARRPLTSPRIDRRSFDRSWYRSALLSLVVAKIVGIVLIVDTFSVQSFDLPKSLFSHALAWLIAGVLIAATLRFGVGIVPRSRIHIAVLVFIAATVLSTLFAENRYIAFFGESKRYLGLTFVVDMVVLYLAVVVAFRTTRDWAILAVAVAAALLITFAYAILQWRGLDPVNWADNSQVRPFATTGNGDIYGQLLSDVFGGALGVAIFASSRRWRVAASAFAAAALGVAAIVATRGSALGVGAAAFGGLIGYVLSKGLRPATMWRVGAAAAVMAVVGLGLVLATPLGERLRGVSTNEAGIADRLVIYRSAIEVFLSRPAFGWGPDSLAVAYPRFSQPESPAFLSVNAVLSSAHSWVLQAAATVGILGLATLTVLIAGAAWALAAAVRRDPSVAGPLLLALIAYWANGLVGVGSITSDWVPWVAFGGAATLGARPASAPLPLAGPIPQAIVLAAAAIGAVSGYGAWQASHDALAAQLATGAHDGTRAAAFARSAVEHDGGRARYWAVLGEAYDVQQQWKRAGDAYAQAATREPYGSTNWESLAVSRTRQALAGDESSGGQAAALEAARRATEVDRHNSAAFIVQAQVATAFRQQDLALRSAATALHLASRDPHYKADPNYQRVAAQAALADTDADAAREVLLDLVNENDNPILRIAIARIALKQGDRGGAVANARRALQLDPNNADALDVLKAAGG